MEAGRSAGYPQADTLNELRSAGGPHFPAKHENECETTSLPNVRVFYRLLNPAMKGLDQKTDKVPLAFPSIMCNLFALSSQCLIGLIAFFEIAAGPSICIKHDCFRGLKKEA